MADKSWKAFERRLARDVGSERIPVSGRQRGESDFNDRAGVAVYQAKLYRSVPTYLRDWLRGICSTASAMKRIGVVVFKQSGDRDDDALVIMRWSDYRDRVLPLMADVLGEQEPKA